MIRSRSTTGAQTHVGLYLVHAATTVSTHALISVKAFMLPQHNPRRFYRERFFSFNVPDFIIAPTRFNANKACRMINDEYRKRFEIVHK